MSRLVSELETILQNLLVEHRKLLRLVEQHEVAIRTMDLKGMDVCASTQEAARLRVAALNNQRISVVQQLIRTMRIDIGPEGLTLTRLAELHPPRRVALLKLRDELREVATAISNRTKVSGRVARAVLGHLNMAIRLLANAVERAGVYTRHGVPKMPRRIGAMETIG
jgi:hypothetical protein